MKSAFPLIALCCFTTGIELFFCVDSRFGMSTADVSSWIFAANVLYLLFSLGVALLAHAVLSRVKTLRNLIPDFNGESSLSLKAFSLSYGALFALHFGLLYRMNWAVNFYMRDPRVWGIGLLILVLSLGLGTAVAGICRRLSKPILALGILLQLVSFSTAVQRVEGQSQSKPDVILISLDTTRPDVLGAYGSTNQTPNIDAFSNSSIRFTQAISPAPLTEPAHLSMLTGYDTLKTGVVSNGTMVPTHLEFISDQLKASGYHTAAFVSGFPLHSRYGWGAHFDIYDDDFGDWMGLHRLHIIQAWDQLVLPAHTLRERRGDTAVSRSINWLNQHSNEQQFLWLHLFDPHAPYEAPTQTFDPPTDGPPLTLPGYWPPPHRAITSTDWLLEAYNEEVRYVDTLLGPLFEAIEEDAIVILTSDHGESLLEHDYLFEHGDNLYDPSLRIPLILRIPNSNGQVNDCLVSSMDIPATLTELLGLSDPQDRSGPSLMRAIESPICPERIQLSTTVAARFVESPPVAISARSPIEKLILNPESQDCFDLLSDPNERSPLSPSQCTPALMKTIEAIQSVGETRLPELDSQTQDALEALGYIE